MPLIISVLIIFLLFFLLAKLAGVAIYNATKLSVDLRIPKFAVGFFILGFATSLPEISVSVNSIIKNTPELSVANLVGASFVLLSLAIGASAILSKNIKIGGSLTNKDMFLSLIVIAIPAIVLLDGSLTQVDGIVLLTFYTVYALFLNREDSFIKSFEKGAEKSGAKVLKPLALIVISSLLVFVCSRVIVVLSLDIANTLKISYTLLGILVFSIGTNLPELTLVFKSLSKSKEVGIGDFLGSASVNTLVVGLVALARPFTFKVTDYRAIFYSCLLLILAAILCAVFIRTKKRISRREGLVLVLIYLVFVLVGLGRM